MKVAIVSGIIALVCSAYGTQVEKRPDLSKMTKQERKEYTLRMTGGFIKDPKGLKGKVAIVDTQDIVSAEKIKAVARRLSSDARLNFEYQKTSPANPETILENSGAVAVVIVVNDPKGPIACVAIEDRWAVVNVAKIDRGLKTKEAKDKFVPSRTAKEISRMAALLCGAASSRFKGNIMDVTKLEDLDLIEDGLPMDNISAMAQNLQKLGLTRERIVPYRKAVQEGWAPAPTNEYQKAVWDKVHALPKNPMKIEFDPKKGK
jgi:hypothetical protein